MRSFPFRSHERTRTVGIWYAQNLTILFGRDMRVLHAQTHHHDILEPPPRKNELQRPPLSEVRTLIIFCTVLFYTVESSRPRPDSAVEADLLPPSKQRYLRPMAYLSSLGRGVHLERVLRPWGMHMCVATHSFYSCRQYATRGRPRPGGPVSCPDIVTN